MKKKTVSLLCKNFALHTDKFIPDVMCIVHLRGYAMAEVPRSISAKIPSTPFSSQLFTTVICIFRKHKELSNFTCLRFCLSYAENS